MTQGADREAPRGAFFGRRKGKKLRPGRETSLREAFPRLQVPATLPAAGLPALFGRPVSDVWLEIGFGGGEHLLARARENPDIGFIGCEPFINGLAKLVGAIEATGLGTIRLSDEDARLVLDRLPPASIGRAFLLYPDPWPKRRQRKRRFVSDENLLALARVLRPGGQFRFATDIDDYAGWTLARIARSRYFRWDAEGAGDWREPWPGWQSTRYEAKAIQAGRRPIYLTFARTDAAA